MVSKNFNITHTTDEPAARKTVTLAHLSDPHISCMNNITGRDLAGKRLLGYLRWKLQRSAEHGDHVLAALKTDLARTEPDHIAVTGDLTHLSLPAEFEKARQWLQSLGPPSKVTVIPGNHDTYVKTDWCQTMAHWTDYMLSDNLRKDDHNTEDTTTLFPCLRTRGCVAIIGVCTARPSAPHLAVGSIGARQLHKLATILSQTARKRFYRVVLIHHPPASGSVSWRKRLTDAAAMQSLLAHYGAELILHGHAHRTLRYNLQTPGGNLPVVGIPSISALSRRPERRARYHIYRITPVDAGWDVRREVRLYSPDDNCFIRESEQRFNNPVQKNE
ncbi:metallophosphoesterase family protein [Thermodesulfobacteriota bacterium]